MFFGFGGGILYKSGNDDECDGLVGDLPAFDVVIPVCTFKRYFIICIGFVQKVERIETTHFIDLIRRAN